MGYIITQKSEMTVHSVVSGFSFLLWTLSFLPIGTKGRAIKLIVVVIVFTLLF